MADNVYTNQEMLEWLGYFSEKMEVSPEKSRYLTYVPRRKMSCLQLRLIKES